MIIIASTDNLKHIMMNSARTAGFFAISKTAIPGLASGYRKHTYTTGTSPSDTYGQQIAQQLLRNQNIDSDDEEDSTHNDNIGNSKPSMQDLLLSLKSLWRSATNGLQILELTEQAVNPSFSFSFFLPAQNNLASTMTATLNSWDHVAYGGNDSTQDLLYVKYFDPLAEDKQSDITLAMHELAISAYHCDSVIHEIEVNEKKWRSGINDDERSELIQRFYRLLSEVSDKYKALYDIVNDMFDRYEYFLDGTHDNYGDDTIDKQIKDCYNVKKTVADDLRSILLAKDDFLNTLKDKLNKSKVERELAHDLWRMIDRYIDTPQIKLNSQPFQNELSRGINRLMKKDKKGETVTDEQKVEAARAIVMRHLAETLPSNMLNWIDSNEVVPKPKPSESDSDIKQTDTGNGNTSSKSNNPLPIKLLTSTPGKEHQPGRTSKRIPLWELTPLVNTDTDQTLIKVATKLVRIQEVLDDMGLTGVTPSDAAKVANQNNNADTKNEATTQLLSQDRCYLLI